MSSSFEYGGVKFDLSYEEALHTARIQGRAVSLANGENVILVDKVDENGGGEIKGAVKLDGYVDSPTTTPLSAILSRTADAISFLRCGVGTANENVDRMLNQYVCDDLKKQ